MIGTLLQQTNQVRDQVALHNDFKDRDNVFSDCSTLHRCRKHLCDGQQLGEQCCGFELITAMTSADSIDNVIDTHHVLTIFQQEIELIARLVQSY
jgi:hypothetical protein